MATVGTSIAAAGGAATDVGATFAQSAEAWWSLWEIHLLFLVQNYLQLT